MNTDSAANRLFQTIGVVLIILGIRILGDTLGGTIGAFLYSLKGVSFEEIALKLKNPTDKNLILFLQFFVQLFTFFILPFLYVYNFKRNLVSQFGFSSKSIGVPLILLILILFALVPFVNLSSELNKAVNFPDFWGIEDKIIYLEESGKKMTDLIITIYGTGDFILTVLVVAVIPAIGEEFLFRGIAQNQLKSILKNHHLAIWVAAFIFSFVHFQFYGFIPRMLLGVVFGYLYFWSGNLLVPIFIHFLNNFLALISMYLYKEKAITVDPESVDIFPVWGFVISLVLLTYLLSAFKKYSQKDPDREINS